MKNFEQQTTPKPIAKPRTTIDVIEEVTSPSKSPIRHHNSSLSATNSPVTRSINRRPQSLDLKPINGARKLRENELSYFGLNMATSNITQSHNDSSTVISSRSHSSPHQINHQGKLISDKPDLLLNHSLPTSMPKMKPTLCSDNDKLHRHRAISVDSDGSGSSVPIYENIQPVMRSRHPVQYNRSADIKRDEQNLRELKAGADDMKKV